MLVFPLPIGVEGGLYRGPSGGAASVTLKVQYTGIPTLLGVSDVIRFPTHAVLRCPVNTSGEPFVADESTIPDGGVEVASSALPPFPLSASVLVGIRIRFESVGPEPPALDPTVDTGGW